jgi:hypothetical protein
VLLFDAGQGVVIELVGVHLKSKINQVAIEYDAEGNLTQAYVQQALEARIKLATEARNIRQYINAKFELYSRALAQGDLPLRARPGAAKVEHEAFERHNAGAGSSVKTSDHRPVSIVLDER